ncbi:MAG: KipI antagonist [Balneola sp.]|jgi:biotin-dependent carboxylase-like uncharacterized protein|nr:KipI antagonist [Balneola sp.]MBE80466.1 KipI antagonist [Balneola sp.]|tara:strand:- start:2138 stop:3058 length:921 start_codon:yes stop_codon:yes gene_type:complete
MNGSLEVLDGGMLTTVQDAGRVGYRNYGVPVSGVMDDHAYSLVNWLVGNEGDAPVLEMTIQGGRYQFNSDAIIGLSGGEAEITLNSEQRKANETLVVHSGDILNIGQIKKGCRIYLAIRGNWEIEKVMSSYSTYIPASFGGIKGRKLKKGDLLNWQTKSLDTEVREVPQKLIPYFSSKQRIRLIEGPEWQWLPEDQRAKFLATEFEISSQSNRMGIRLKVQDGFNVIEREMKSAPVVPGIIQLPKGGSPIVLMKDAQSVGGYPRIAKVIDADLWRLGQVWTSNRLSFKMISIKEAKKLTAIQKNRL